MQQSDTQRWLVKDFKGRVYGPYSNQQLHKLVKRGVFSGEEKLAEYPSGQFIEISKIPELYDLILEAISNEAIALSENEQREELSRTAEEFQAEEQKKTQPRTSPSGHSSNRAIKESKKEIAPKTEVPKKETQVIPAELGPATKAKPAKKINPKFWGLIFVVAVVAAILFSGEKNNFSQSNMPTDGFSLIAPRVKRSALSERDLTKKYAQALKLYQSDTPENYYQSMVLLSGVIEDGYPNAEALSLLCLAYRELWPFSNQDAKDLLTLTHVVQMSSKQDQTGFHSGTCRVVQYLLSGQYEAAKSMIESTLKNFPNGAAFYEMYADALIGNSDYLLAKGYITKAIDLWPLWLKPHVILALINDKLDQQDEAKKGLEFVVKTNPKHAVAYLRLAELSVYKKNSFAEGHDFAVKSIESGALTKKNKAKALLIVAAEFNRNNKKTEAAETAKQAYTADPTNPQIKELLKSLGVPEKELVGSADKELVALGEEYLKKGNYFSAQAEFKAAYETNPKNSRAALLAARSLWKLNQTSDAMDWARKAIQADKKLVDGYILLADYLSQRYDFKGAAQLLSQATKLGAANFQVLTALAEYELRRRNYKGAIEVSRRSIGMYDSDVKTHMVLAQAYLEAENSQAAYETMTKAIHLDSSNIEARGLYAQSMAAFQGQSSAVDYLKDLINTYQYEMEYRVALAKVYLRTDSPSNAISVLEQVVEANPRHKEAYILLAGAYDRTGDDRAALKSYLYASSLDPADVYSSFHAGMVYLKMNNVSQAAQQFRQVVKINSLYPNGHYQLGRAALLMGDYELAFQESQIEKRQNPNLSAGYLLAGDTWMKKNNYTKAAQEYQKAVGLDPRASTYVALARAYRLAENNAIALSLIGRAIKIEDGYADIYKELGAIHEARGENAEAVVAYQKYIEIAPNAPDRKVIEGQLKTLGGQ